MPSPLPVTADLAAYRGDTWAQTFRLLDGSTPVDLTTATVACQARRSFDSTQATLTTAKTGLGEVTVTQPAGGLAPGTWAYDLEVTIAGAVTTWVRGILTVTADITNAP